MRTILLIVGIVLILIGFLSVINTLDRMAGGFFRSPSGSGHTIRRGRVSRAMGQVVRPRSPTSIGDAVFCGVLYAAGIGAFYMRRDKCWETRALLLFLGIVIILFGFLASWMVFCSPPHHASVGDAAFFAVLSGSRFTVFYLRQRIIKPKEGK